MSETFSIAKSAAGTPSSVPFRVIKEHILGKSYDLSLAIVGDKRARTLNRTYKNKDYPTNVLSFPIDTNVGEIVINIRKAEREARAYKTTLKTHIAYLFIHGLLHLDGLTHGSTMEKEEKRLLRRFGFKHPNVVGNI